MAILATLSGCRRKSHQDGGAYVQRADAAGGPLAVAFERFVSARALSDGGLEVAGVTRDQQVILAKTDRNLMLREPQRLVTGFRTTEDSEVALAPGGLVVATGSASGEPGAWLLRAGLTPRALGRDWCLVGDGVAWLERDADGVRARYLRHAGGDLEQATAHLDARGDAQIELVCGATSVAVSERDGERLSIAVGHPGEAGFAGPLATIEVDREGALDDEPREHRVLVRANDGVLVVRIGEDGVELREIAGGQPGAWQRVVRDGSVGDAREPLAIDPDADVLEVAASPIVGGPAWMLVSEPLAGARACPGGDPSRRVTLYTLRPVVGDAGHEPVTFTSRPLVELACGVEAIQAHLDARAGSALMWWTEPVADGRCAQPGIGVGAVVQATTEAPGAHAIPLLAEGVSRVGGIGPAAGHLLAVIRSNGGCAPYDAPGNGALAWVASR